MSAARNIIFLDFDGVMDTAYPIGTGIGAVGTVILGIMVFHELATFRRLFSLQH